MVAFEVVSLLFNEIDNGRKRRLGADRNLDGHRFARQPVLDGLQAHVKIRAHLVHLVDKTQPRHPILVGLAPDGFGLRLHALGTVKQSHCAIEDAQRPLHLDRKIYMARGVNNINPVVFPKTSSRGARNSDAAFLLLLHPVHLGRALVHLADFMLAAGVKQNALGRGSFAGVNMGHDADVTGFFQ